jgi:hypothetical protein
MHKTTIDASASKHLLCTQYGIPQVRFPIVLSSPDLQHSSRALCVGAYRFENVQCARIQNMNITTTTEKILLRQFC